MARNRAAAETDTVTTEAPEVEAVETETVTPEATEATEAEVTEAPEAEKPAEAPIDLTDFNTAVAAALEAADETTGDVPEAPLAAVVAEYRKLDGIKAKNAAKKANEASMKEAMDEASIFKARAFFKIGQVLVAGPSSSKSASTSTPREPVNPTESFTERVAGLKLALNLAQRDVPEGIDEDWAEKAQAKIEAGTAAAAAYIEAEGTEGAELPETDAWVIAAVKLAAGKSAKIGGRKATGGTSTFEGERRNVGNHIAEAFANVESGTFLSVADIRKHKSEEYGDDSPSAGAVSARLSDKSQKANPIEGITATTQDGKKGAVKN